MNSQTFNAETWPNIVDYVNTQRITDKKPDLYWKLYCVNAPKAKDSKERVMAVAKNIDEGSGDLENSLSKLNDAIRLNLPNPARYMVIIFRSSPGNDASGNTSETEYIFENPRITDLKNSQLSGNNPKIGNTESYSGSYGQMDKLLDMQQKMFELNLQHQRELAERDKEDLLALVDATQNAQKTFWDKIFDLMEKPAAKILVSGLIAKITGTPANTPQVSGGDEDTDEEEEHSDLAEKIHTSLNTIKPIFNDVGDFMMEVATYVRNNPAQAQNLRIVLKQEAQKNG